MVIMKTSSVYQAYYTDSDSILSYMTGILNITSLDSILEPCGGDGVFVDKILDASPSAHIDVLELNPQTVDILRGKYADVPNISVRHCDTLLDRDVVTHNKLYDKIIGNPPYGARNDSEKKNALKSLYPGLYIKESYTLFLYACVQCLKENGELSFIVPDTFLSLHRHMAIRRYLLTNTRIRELALFPSSFFPGVNFGYANLCIITLAKSSDMQSNLENRLLLKTSFKCVEDLNVEGACHSKEVSQRSIFNNVDSAFMFNSTESLVELINDSSLQKIGDIATCVTGFYSGNDKKYLHPIDESVPNAKKYNVASLQDLHLETLTEEEKKQGIRSSKCYVPIVKGGNVRYIKPNIWFMDWSEKAIAEYKSSEKTRFQNADFYFRDGIGIPMVRSTKLTGALIDGRLFDQSIVGVFPKDKSWIMYLLAFFNSSICTSLIQAINPSTNNSANYIKKIPFVNPNLAVKRDVENLVDEVILSIKKGDGQYVLLEEKLDSIFNKLYLQRIGVNEEESTKRSYKQRTLFDFASNKTDVLS